MRSLCRKPQLQLSYLSFIDSKSHSCFLLREGFGIWDWLLCGSFTKISVSKLRTSIHNINIWMKWIMDELRPRCTLGWTLLAAACEMCVCSQVGTSAPQHLGSVGTLHHTPHYEDHPPRSTTHTPTNHPPQRLVIQDNLRPP